MHIHLLHSSVALIKRLIDAKFDPQSIIIVPKIYSTIEVAEKRAEKLGCVVVKSRDAEFQPGLYDYFANRSLKKGVKHARLICRIKQSRRCIIVDDGGFLTQHWSEARERGDAFDAVSIHRQHLGSTHIALLRLGG
jgi:hypothetical protein